MSPLMSPVGTTPLEDLGETGSLIFGEHPRSRLTIPKALVARLWGQVQEGVRIVPHGGIEVGGLLVGPKSRECGVVVDGIVPLSIKYEHGPCFRMSTSDLGGVAVLVESVQADPSKTVVGLYRSHTRSSEMLRESDREIFAAIEQAHKSFAADFLCFFVVTPVSKSEMSACIWIRNGEDWDRIRFTVCSDPFSVIQAQAPISGQDSVPAKEQLLKPSLGPVPQEVLPSAHEYSAALAAPRPPSRPVLNAVKAAGRPSKGFYALSGLLILAAAAGGYLKRGPAQSTSSTSQQPLRLGFSANREGPAWKLSWDRGAIELMKPSGALLTITDGKGNQQLKLTPADLSSGTIFYTPHGGDLVFSLQLDQGATPIEEHIRVLEDLRSTQKSAERGPQAPPKNTAFQAKASRRRSTLPTELPRAASSYTERHKTISPILSPSVRPNSALAESTASASEPSAAVAPPIKPNDIGPAPVPPTTSAGTGPEKPVSPILSPSVRPNSAPAEMTETPASVPAAAVPPPVKSIYIGPVPIQRVPAQPPPGDFRGVVIRIRMGIDARGKVTKATAIGVTAANSPLVSAAERAALSWQFEPATIAGRPIPSQLDLLLRF